MSAESTQIAPPRLALLLREATVAAELASYLLRGFDTAGLPRGNGEPVLVLPGFGADDWATLPLRRGLQQLGYSVHGWGEGRNLGMRPRLKEALSHRLRALHEQHGQTVTLIGWSLGGVFVREMARAQPALVRQVFTLGSPFSGDPNANNLVKIFALMNPKQAKNPDLEGFRRRCVAPPVHCVAIHTKSDGIVAWQCSLEQESATTENVEVRGSHFGLTLNPEVFRAIATRLPLSR